MFPAIRRPVLTVLLGLAGRCQSGFSLIAQQQQQQRFRRPTVAVSSSFLPSIIIARCLASFPPPVSEKPFYLDKHDPEQVRELLQEVEDRLKDSEKEGFGSKYRGRGPIHAKLRAEAPSNTKRRRVNLKTAMVELRTLYYTRHALKHGAITINELNKKNLAKSFLGEDSKFKMEPSQARLILTEFWRHGESNLFESWKQRNDKHMEKVRKHEKKRLAAEERKRKALEEESQGQEDQESAVQQSR